MTRKSCTWNSSCRSIGRVFAVLIPGLSTLFTCGTIQTQAATAVLTPVADDTLIETEPDNNMGGVNFFNAGTTGIDTRNRGLIQFDLSSAIPQGSTVLSAELVMDVVFIPPNPQFSVFGVHRVLMPWGPGDNSFENIGSPGLGSAADLNEVTWNHRFAGTDQTWSAPGGQEGVDYVSTASSVVFVEEDDTYLFDSLPRMVQDVQAWVDDPSVNHGWMVISQFEDLRFTARRWGASEDPFFGPRLTVTFEPVPEPGTLALGLAALGMAWAGRRYLRKTHKDAEGL